MLRPPFISAAVLTTALVLSCGEQPASFEQTDNPLASRTSNSPDGPGAFVIRGPEFAFFASDPASVGSPPPNITLMVGWTFDQLLDFCATGVPTLSDIERLTVIRPHSSEEVPDLHTIFHAAQSPMLVLETAIPFIDPIGELCDLALNVPHLEGTGQISQTNNDQVVTGERGNATHTAIHGQVTSEEGQRYRVTGTEHPLVLPSGEIRLTFDLNLIPIGQ